MSIETTIYQALEPVLPNTHYVELPDNPTWPAAVFESEATEEPGWVIGGGYEQHVITVVVLARKQSEIITLRKQIADAIAALPGFMGAEEKGDAPYEGDAKIYAYFQNFRVRLPIHA